MLVHSLVQSKAMMRLHVQLEGKQRLLFRIKDEERRMQNQESADQQ